MTGAGHYRVAEHLQQHAKAIADANTGPFGEMPPERSTLRAAALAEAHVRPSA